MDIYKPEITSQNIKTSTFSRGGGGQNPFMILCVVVLGVLSGLSSCQDSAEIASQITLISNFSPGGGPQIAIWIYASRPLPPTQPSRPPVQNSGHAPETATNG